jgi:hypothetical protein
MTVVGSWVYMGEYVYKYDGVVDEGKSESEESDPT